MKKYIYIIVLLFSTLPSVANKSMALSNDTIVYINPIEKQRYLDEQFQQRQQDSIMKARKPIVIAHLNHYLNIIHSLNNNKDLSYLTYIKNQLRYNISDENSIEELDQLRVEIYNAVAELEINKREKDIYEQIRYLTIKNQKMASLNTALSNMSYLITSNGVNGSNGFAVGRTVATVGKTTTPVGGAAVGAIAVSKALSASVPAILILARAGVDYVASQRELKKSAILEEWKFKKTELEKMADLSMSEMTKKSVIYRKYELENSDCINNELLEEFYNILGDTIIERRIMNFTLSDSKRYEIIPDYFYYLGMDYVAVGEYMKAKPLFDQYHEYSEKTKVLNRDEKLGLIAMAQIAYELDGKEVDKLAEEITRHLPNNEMGYLACIYKYLELGNQDKAYYYLSLGLSKTGVQNDILTEFAMRNMSSIMAYKETYSDMYDNYILKSEHVSLSNRLICEYYLYGKFSDPNSIFVITDGSWYEPYTFNVESNLKSVLVADSINVFKQWGKNIFPYNVTKNEISIENLVEEYDFLEDLDTNEQRKFISYFYTSIDEREEKFITRRNLNDKNERKKFLPSSGSDDNNPVMTDLVSLLEPIPSEKALRFIDKFYKDACCKIDDAKKLKAVGEQRWHNLGVVGKNGIKHMIELFSDSTLIKRGHSPAKDKSEECLYVELITHVNLPNVRLKYMNRDGWKLNSIYFIRRGENELVYSADSSL